MNKDKINVSVGKRIRQVRENMGYTRERFSELCDISDSFLSDVERGNKSLTTKTLHKICSATHMSADYILFGASSLESDTASEINGILSILSGMNKEQCTHAENILKEYFLSISGL